MSDSKQRGTCKHHWPDLRHENEPHEQTARCSGWRPVDSPAPQATTPTCPTCGSNQHSVRRECIDLQSHEQRLCENDWHDSPAPSPAETGASELSEWDMDMPRNNRFHDPFEAATPLPEATERGELRPIKPVGEQIINHPHLQVWFDTGYAKQMPDGLWLHYSAVCELLGRAARKAEGR